MALPTVKALFWSFSKKAWSRYATLIAPPGTPPKWVFAPVWSAIYVTVGVAGWLVWRRNGTSRVLRLWGWQLAANALWAPAFFGAHSPALALAINNALGNVGKTVTVSGDAVNPLPSDQMA